MVIFEAGSCIRAQDRINVDSPNNNQSLSSHLMKHLDVQLYRTEIGICNLDNNGITDFDFQSRFRFKNKMKSKNEFRPVFQNIHQNFLICFTQTVTMISVVCLRTDPDNNLLKCMAKCNKYVLFTLACQGI